MSKLLLFLCSSYLFIACNTAPTATEQNATFAIEDTITEQIKELKKSDCETIQFNTEEDVSKNITLIQKWWHNLEKGVIRNVRDQNDVIKLVLKTPHAVLSKQQLQSIQQQIDSYRNVLHAIIGKSNGYPLALVIEHITYEEDASILCIAIVEDLKMDCSC